MNTIYGITNPKEIAKIQKIVKAWNKKTGKQAVYRPDVNRVSLGVYYDAPLHTFLKDARITLGLKGGI